MKKTLNVVVDGKEELIRYSENRTNEGSGFAVDTSIPELPRFLFIVKNGIAQYLKTGEPEKERLIIQIIEQIAEDQQ